MTLVNTQCRLAARPVGLAKPTDWTFTEEEVPSPADGELLVRVEYLSIDPAMRTWMNAGRSYVPPVEIGEVMRAAGIARVIESRHADFAVGDEVHGVFGIQRYALSDGRGVTPVDTNLAPAPAHLGVLGISGLTAYFGLLDIGRPEPGQTVVISGDTGSGRKRRGTDRTNPGLPGDRYRRRPGEVSLAGRGARVRRRHRLQGRRSAHAAKSTRSQRH
jgi:NADPH-dependent curcumin reductase CurA